MVEACGKGTGTTSEKEQSPALDASTISPLQNKSLKLLRKERAVFPPQGKI